ncbi:MAG: hypothetical protein NVSMB29_12420 [Candidatus Dormibacteria bacterium]
MDNPADELAQRAARVLPRRHDARGPGLHPCPGVERAISSCIWLVDDRELIDYTMGHGDGALLPGHAHPARVKAADPRRVFSPRPGLSL